MRYLISIFIIIVFIAIFVQNCDRKDPYSIGVHWDYSIVCENGYIYKILGNKRGIIQILNSDGSPLKCDQKIY